MPIIPFNKRCSEKYLIKQRQLYGFRKSIEEMRILGQSIINNKIDEILIFKKKFDGGK